MWKTQPPTKTMVAYRPRRSSLVVCCFFLVLASCVCTTSKAEVRHGKESPTKFRRLISNNLETTPTAMQGIVNVGGWKRNFDDKLTLDSNGRFNVHGWKRDGGELALDDSLGDKKRFLGLLSLFLATTLVSSITHAKAHKSG